jgi:hypothetical protein
MGYGCQTLPTCETKVVCICALVVRNVVGIERRVLARLARPSHILSHSCIGERMVLGLGTKHV